MDGDDDHNHVDDNVDYGDEEEEDDEEEKDDDDDAYAYGCDNNSE